MAKILFIEDEDDLISAFVDTLEDNGNTVTKARSGEEAVRYLNGGDHSFNLIILDIMLPQGDVEGSPFISENIGDYERGVEILRQLRKEMRGEETPVIVLSAVGADEVKKRVLELGVKRYFTKPVSLGRFMDEVNNVLSQKTAS
jgi:DNA-binding response OmpR family regulator